MIKVLIVDDSILMRTILTDMVSVPGEIAVVGTARNGIEAIEKVKELAPDVVTMDVEMPKMDGITSLKAIMKERPTAVIMVSALTQQGARETIQALSSGAFDFIGKPSGSISLDIDKVKENLLAKIRAASKVDAAKLRHGNLDLPERQKVERKLDRARKLIVIGSSTGGPGALERVLTRIPGNIKAGILVVQHMPAGFTRSLADRLNKISEIDIKEAEEGDAILEGRALIAPGNYHMLVRKGMSHLITLNQEPPVHAVRPAADVTMRSAAGAFNGSDIVGVILTGMGTDGAFGMKEIKDRGGRTIACDEKTCVIFGMPKAAIELGCIDRVVPLEDIAAQIEDML